MIEEDSQEVLEDIGQLIAPSRMPSNVSQAMEKYGRSFDAIGNEISKQNAILVRSLSQLRRIEEDLGDAKFFLEQMSENYQEALDDFEVEERKKEARKKFVARLTSPFKRKKPEAPSATPQKPAPKKEGNWLDGITSFFSGGNKPQPPQKLASGGVSPKGTGDGNIIQPGIYTNPVRGNLAPGTAVIPLNRNWGKDIFGSYELTNQQQSLGEVMYKAASALLGSGVAVYGSALRMLGPLAGFFNQNIPGIINTVAGILDISHSAVINMFGGPAYAGVAPNEREERYFHRSWRIYMDKNGLYFGGPGGDKRKKPVEIAADILTIGSEGEGLRFKGGTNVGKAPAWIPFSKSDSGKIGYVSGFGLRWGRQHSGIDLDGEPGIKIITPFAGEVYRINKGAVEGDRSAGGGYGNLVGIKHDNPKVFTFYGHLKDVADSIEVGKKVTAGQVIGTLGNTGFSTGPHLHWEVRTQEDDGQIDPVEWTHQNKPSFSRGGMIPEIPTLFDVSSSPTSFIHQTLRQMAREIIEESQDPPRIDAAQSKTSATSSIAKPVVKEVTLTMPSQPSMPSMTSSSSTNSFVKVRIPTKNISAYNNMGRMA